MTHYVLDRTKEQSTSAGLTNFTFAGSPPEFLPFALGMPVDGDTTWYCAEYLAEWELGLMTRASATSFSRSNATVIKSSNANAMVNFSGNPVVYATVPAQKMAAMGPSLSAYHGVSSQTITANTWTKVQLNTVVFDTGSCFDNVTNFRWTPNVAGYYHVDCSAVITSSTTLTAVEVAVYKNGAIELAGTYHPGVTTQGTSQGSKLIYMNGTTDYLELWAYANPGTITLAANSVATYMTAYLASLPGAPLLAPSPTVGPAFRAYLSANQTGVTSATFIKAVLNTEEFDTGGCFDTALGRWTPNVPGYYEFSWLLSGAGATLSDISCQLNKNGAAVADSVYGTGGGTSRRIVGSRLIWMNGTTDYAELFGYLSGTGLLFQSGIRETSFEGHFVRGA